MIRQFASLLLAVTLIATFSTRAFAHARYQGSNPADGETVSASPGQVTSPIARGSRLRIAGSTY